jgi:hypothetical protein
MCLSQKFEVSLELSFLLIALILIFDFDLSYFKLAIINNVSVI